VFEFRRGWPKNIVSPRMRGYVEYQSSFYFVANRAERCVMYYRCLAHIPRTLATVADSYRLLYTVSALRLLERWNPGRHDREGRTETSLYDVCADSECIFHLLCVETMSTASVTKNVIRKEFL